MVRARVESLGTAGAAWADALPGLLDRLADEWHLSWGRGLPGGSASYVVEAERDGELLAVKVPIPDAAVETRSGEARLLGEAAGRGYVRLHAADEESGALLLERLGTTLAGTGGDPLDQATALADTLAEAWQVDDDDAPDLDKAAALHDLVVDLDQRLGNPTDPRALRLALEYAGRRSAERPGTSTVVVHGDPHPANTLRVLQPREGAPGGWVLVDPDGFREDPAYDLGVVLRDFSTHLTGPDASDTLRVWCETVGNNAGIDPQRIWEWAFLERVSTGLYVLGFGAERVAAPYLTTAAHLAG